MTGRIRQSAYSVSLIYEGKAIITGDDETDVCRQVAALRARAEAAEAERDQRREQVDILQQWIDEINVALGPGCFTQTSRLARAEAMRAVVEAAGDAIPALSELIFLTSHTVDAEGYRRIKGRLNGALRSLATLTKGEG